MPFGNRPAVWRWPSHCKQTPKSIFATEVRPVILACKNIIGFFKSIFEETVSWFVFCSTLNSLYSPLRHHLSTPTLSQSAHPPHNQQRLLTPAHHTRWFHHPCRRLCSSLPDCSYAMLDTPACFLRLTCRCWVVRRGFLVFAIIISSSSILEVSCFWILALVLKTALKTVFQLTEAAHLIRKPREPRQKKKKNFSPLNKQHISYSWDANVGSTVSRQLNSPLFFPGHWTLWCITTPKAA